MTTPSYARTPVAGARIPVPAWAWVLFLLALTSSYLVGQESGAWLEQTGAVAHEFFHDARHSLGVPCH